MRFLILILLSTFQLNAQVVDRYNYIQRPTDNSATIAWRTVNASIGTINWGLTPGNLTNSLTEVSATSKHYFDIYGLSPNTLYYYQTTTDMGFSSDVDHFYTAMPDTTMPFSFLHYGDCGFNNGVQNTIASLMEADNTVFGIVAGDVDHGNGDDYDNVFFGVYQNTLKNSCHFTAIGNHDTYADNAATYLDNFYLPTNNPQNSERYYSFVWGNAKFVVLDSNSPYTTGSDQNNWLISEIECNQYQWLFVVCHNPAWTNAWSSDYSLPFSPFFLYQGDEDMRTDLVPLFEEYNVDFVLNGHSHSYQRGELNGVKYVISGGAGAAILDANTNSNSPNIDTEIYVNHYVRFEVSGDTVTYLAIDENNNIIDSVTTIKSALPSQIPVVTYLNSELWSTQGETYTWFLDSAQIAGADEQSFIPTVTGEYYVVITTTSGCALSSDLFIFNVTTVEEIDETIFKVFPNPTSGKVTITMNGALSVGTEIQISNSIGKVTFKDVIDENKPSSYNIDLTTFPKGIYFLSVKNSSSVFTKLIVFK